MITTLVQFKLPEAKSKNEAQKLFMGSANKYQTLEGLVRKYYLLSDDGMNAGGVYLWESREYAEQAFDEEWSKNIQQKYGSIPSVMYFNSPVVIDNYAGEINQY